MSQSKVVVIGAGAFGGWTALWLQSQGLETTLLDGWGPGNSRASSGGETRVVRTIYGSDHFHWELAVRAIQLWKECERRWEQNLFRHTGVLWMTTDLVDFVESALPFLDSADLPYQRLSLPEARVRYPQINFEQVKSVVLEEEAGYVMARRSCRVVVEQFLQKGGTYHPCTATPGTSQSGELKELILSDGSKLKAEQYVFACGPWLRQLFPEVLEDVLTVTRQEVFFFGPPTTHPYFQENHLPVWVDYGKKMVYGIPADGRRGFKIADDTQGPQCDPTSTERILSAESVRAAQAYAAFRFPQLKGAPLIEGRVCQYTNTVDHRFLIDRHPHIHNILLVGGGSGHGFKHGPAVGEQVARLVKDDSEPPSQFSLSRFLGTPS